MCWSEKIRVPTQNGIIYLFYLTQIYSNYFLYIFIKSFELYRGNYLLISNKKGLWVMPTILGVGLCRYIVGTYGMLDTARAAEILELREKELSSAH